jgi:hypothetical protein
MREQTRIRDFFQEAGPRIPDVPKPERMGYDHLMYRHPTIRASEPHPADEVLGTMSGDLWERFRANRERAKQERAELCDNTE